MDTWEEVEDLRIWDWILGTDTEQEEEIGTWK